MKKRIIILLLAVAAILAAGCFILRRQSDTPSSGEGEPVASESYNPGMGEAVEVETQCPEVSGLCLSPRGGGLLAASDEDGVYHISWTGETEPFYVEKGWLDCEGVTMDPANKDVYYIVGGRQEEADSKVSRPLFCEGCEVSGGLRFAPAPPNVSCVPA